VIIFLVEYGGDVRYVGEIKIPKTCQFSQGERLYKAFDFQELLKEMRGRRNHLKSGGSLLGITVDPVITVFYRFETGKLLKYAYCVYDCAVGDVGIVSLFRLDEKYSKKVIAHNLGHGRNLIDHVAPIDLMYEGLIREKRTLPDEPFCNRCERKLKEE
jgi:hypothetical protein